MNRNLADREKILAIVQSTPGVASVMASRGQLLLGRDIDPRDMIQINSGTPSPVHIRVSIKEDVRAVQVLHDLERELTTAVPVLEGAPTKWVITVVSA